jgi:hypothetical protein
VRRCTSPREPFASHADQAIVEEGSRSAFDMPMLAADGGIVTPDVI